MEDRFNYVASFGLAMFDLQKILGFPAKAMGQFGKLGIAFGARGRGSALAHYEPYSGMINLTRFNEDPAIKALAQGRIVKRTTAINRKLYSGGIGSLGHEYGHAIDYFVGSYIDKDSKEFSLSHGDSVSTDFPEELMTGDSPRALMAQFLQKVMFTDRSSKKYTSYYGKLRKYFEYHRRKRDYLLRRNEIFARAFEMFITFKLRKKKQRNRFLVENKYGREVLYKENNKIQRAPIYLSSKELKGLEPIFDKLIASVRKEMKKVKI